MARTLLAVCADLTGAARAADAAGFNALTEEFRAARERAALAELSEAVTAIGRTMARTDVRLHYAGTLAVLAGALVERGADPAPLADPLPRRLDDACRGAIRLAGGERTEAARDAGDALEGLATGACTLLQVSRPVRTGVPGRRALLDHVTEAIPRCGQLSYVRDLLRVLDGERVLVLDRASGRGWSVVLDGVGDNIQLQALIAGRLIGPGRLPGVPPDARLAACFGDGPIDPGGAVAMWWDLTDVHGRLIRDNDVPADIAAEQGARVVILDAAHARRWPACRRYPLMPGRVTMEREFDPAALATTWQAVRHYHAASGRA